MPNRELEILLVEDEPADVELTTRALKENNLANKLLTVEDGAAALDYLFGTGAHAGRNVLDRPKVVVLDLELPKVSGIEVLRRIRGDERTRTLPVVVLTSSREEKSLIESYDLGVNSYIVKPVDFEQFMKAVRDIGLYWLLLNQPPRVR